MMRIVNLNHKLCLLFLLGVTSCSTNSPDISKDEVHSRWIIPFDGSDSEPIIHDATIYIGSSDGAIYAIDPKNGKYLWKYQTGMNAPKSNVIITSGKSFEEMIGVSLDAKNKRKGRREIKATPVIEDGIVYIGSRDYSFYALDAINGKLQWVTNLGYEIFEKAIVTEEHIIVRGIMVGPGDEAIFVLNRKDGVIKWTTQGKGSATDPAFKENNVFYMNEPDNEDERDLIITANAADIYTGNLLWSVPLKGRDPSRPIISQNIMFVSAYEGYDRLPHLYAINLSNGSLAWDFKAGDTAYITSEPPTVGEKFLYYVTEIGLFSINKDTGKQAWFLEGEFSQYGMVLGELLYVHGDSLYSINPKTGEVIRRYKDKGFLKSVGETIYLSVKEGLVALNTSTGKELWKFKTGSFFKKGTDVSATPLIFKNYIIFPMGTKTFFGQESIQGHLYSLDVHTGKTE